jgi:predicted nucleic acid-binding protein
VLDTGAVIAHSRGDFRVREHLLWAARQGYIVVLPAIVILEALRPRPDDPRVRRAINAVDEVLPLTRTIALEAAGLAHRSGVTDLADAVVVVEAIRVPGSHIVTSDPDDVLDLLESATHRGRIIVHRV